MFDNKRDCYLKLRADFFDSDYVPVIESMKDGILYINILLKLYLKALEYDGRLLIKGDIPYTEEMIAAITRHDLKTVKEALQIFQELNITGKSETGAIFIRNFHEIVGKEISEGADGRSKMD